MRPRSHDPDLVTVRDRLDDLPAAEREDWKRFWTDVATVLAKARDGK